MMSIRASIGSESRITPIPKRSGVVSLYEHLTLWCGRANAVVTVRHEHDQQVDFVAVEVAHRLLDRLESAPDPDDGAATVRNPHRMCCVDGPVWTTCTRSSGDPGGLARRVGSAS